MSSLLYVYALVDLPMALDITGAMDEPLALIPAATGWLVVGQRPGLPVASASASASGSASASASAPAASPETLRAQDRIVRALASRAEAVLPMRFGTCVENETALQTRMARFTSDHLRAALARVRGCEQMTLRLFRPEPPAAPAAHAPRRATASTPARPGTAYLEGRAAALATSLPDLLAPLRRALAEIVRDEILDATKRPPLIGSAYHLIARGDAARYCDALEVAATPETVTIRTTGPSPAYAFAKDALP